MKAKTKTRLLSYIIDILLLSLIISPIYFLLPQSQNIENLDIELNELNEQYLNQEISTNNYFRHYSEINYNYDSENVLNVLITTIVMIIYFIVIPYFSNGQTLGQKIKKIKIKKENGELTMNDLIIRNIFINGLGVTLINLLCIFILSPLSYLILTLTLGIIQIIIVICCVIGVLKNGIGLHDKITNTIVVNI